MVNLMTVIMINYFKLFLIHNLKLGDQKDLPIRPENYELPFVLKFMDLFIKEMLSL